MTFEAKCRNTYKHEIPFIITKELIYNILVIYKQVLAPKELQMYGK